MDHLTLKLYQRKGHKHKAFVEFFVNDKPLSEILDELYNSKWSVLDSSIGILGSWDNTASEVVKLKRLLNKTITERDFRNMFPSSFDEDKMEVYVDRCRDELSYPEIIIYCCAACGDYECGGVAVTIERDENQVTWVVSDEEVEICFTFDKYQYYETLGNRLVKLQSQLRKV